MQSNFIDDFECEREGKNKFRVVCKIKLTGVCVCFKMG